MSPRKSTEQLAGLLAADPVFKEARRLAAETTGFRIGVIALPRPRRSRLVPLPSFAAPGRGSSFCQLVRNSPLVRRCDRSDERGAQLCARRGGPAAYRCHAGLTEVIAPVALKGRLVAAVNCGQVLMRRPARRDFARLWKRLGRSGLDRRDLERAYLAIPVCSEERVRTVARIIAMTAEHLAMSLRLGEAGHPAPTADQRAGRYVGYCARLVEMIESGAGDQEVVAGMDRLAARLAGVGQANPQAVSATVEYLVEHYARGPSLAEAARRAGLSPYYLGRIFRRSVGLSPARFLRELRMRRARELLSERSLSVSAVAGRVGYQDPAYFSRHFRDSFGQSPGRVRSQT